MPRLNGSCRKLPRNPPSQAHTSPIGVQAHLSQAQSDRFCVRKHKQATVGFILLRLAELLRDERPICGIESILQS